VACQDIAAGRYVTARELLAATGDHWDLRCHRMLVLAQAAADTGAADRWGADRPGDVDAAVLRTRTGVIRAIRAHRRGHPRATDLIEQASDLCQEAADRYWSDPTPWVALLHLAQNVPASSPGMLVVDKPHELMRQVQERDRWNREGHQRFIGTFSPALGGSIGAMVDAVLRALGDAPHGSALWVLPLHIHAESFRRQADGNTDWEKLILADQQWAKPYAQVDILNAHDRWFAHPGRGEAFLPDLHLLAHALWKIYEFAKAGEVFAEIGDYALLQPWSLHGPAEEVFRRARDRCLKTPP
jgi:hypothetical protein